MAKWAFWTVLLYIGLVIVLFVPLLLWLTFMGENSISDILDMYSAWQFWLVFGIIVLIQAVFLLIPVKISNDSYQPRRHIWLPVVATALALSIVLIGIIWSILVAIWADDGFEIGYPWLIPAFFGVSWIIWSVLFYRFYRNAEPGALTQRLTTWLLRGSILELLIAVPSHIIVRRRGDCCAPGVTFFGIATGVVIMALAFGPGLFFLFCKRFERMKPASIRNGQQVSN
ncbi:MAG: hypothetical protein ACYSU4_07430 [Planctomycetota bacterium]|jgi:uncharacterized membrane protein